MEPALGFIDRKLQNIFVSILWYPRKIIFQVLEFLFFLDVEGRGTAGSVVQVESKYVLMTFVFSVLTGIMKIKINLDKI